MLPVARLKLKLKAEKELAPRIRRTKANETRTRTAARIRATSRLRTVARTSPLITTRTSKNLEEMALLRTVVPAAAIAEAVAAEAVEAISTNNLVAEVSNSSMKMFRPGFARIPEVVEVQIEAGIAGAVVANVAIATPEDPRRRRRRVPEVRAHERRRPTLDCSMISSISVSNSITKTTPTIMEEEGAGEVEVEAATGGVENTTTISTNSIVSNASRPHLPSTVTAMIR